MSRDMSQWLIVLVACSLLTSAFALLPTATEAANTWIVEVVDTSSNWSGWGNIAIDSNDRPHIAYIDVINFLLKYAYWDGFEWRIQTVDGSRRGVSLALDSSDRPHISYIEMGTYNLKYAHYDGFFWNIETVDCIGSQCDAWTSIDLDSFGRPHIAYTDTNNIDLKYAYRSGPSWHIERVDYEGRVGYDAHLALDSDDRAHISYLDTWNETIKYAHWTGSEWTLQFLDPTLWSYRFSFLDVDSEGSPHILYQDDSDSKLKLAVLNGTVWEVEVVRDGINTSCTLSMAIDSDDRPHIAYEQTNVLYYFLRENSTWRMEVIDSGFPNGYNWPSISVDSNDKPHVSFSSDTVGMNRPSYLKYARTVPEDAGPPSNLTAHLGGSDSEDVTLIWDLSVDDKGGARNVIRYDLYRSTVYDSNQIGYDSLQSVPSGTSSFVDALTGEGDPNNYFYFVCSVSAANTSSCSSNQAGKFTRPLTVGPNLVSIPLIQSNESIETVLQTVKYDKAWYYDSPSQEWKWYMTSKNYRRGLWNVNHTIGLWINVTGPSNLTVAGVVPAQTEIQLVKGWNLVSFPSFNTSYTVADLKTETGATRVEGMETMPPFPPSRLRELGDADVLQAGYGYWVRVEADTLWKVGIQ